MGASFSILENFDQVKEVLEKTFECCPDALVISDQDGRILLCNPQMENMFGYSRLELIGQTVEILLPERFRKVHPAHRKAYSTQASMRPMGIGLELYARRKDGSEFPVDIMLSPVQTAQGLLVLSVVRDVTQQKKMQEALRQTEQRFALLIENARDYAIFLMDTAGRVITWNPGAERLKGYRAEEIVGRSFSCFYRPEDVKQGQPENALRIADAEGRFESEGWRVRKDGSQFWANAVITRIHDSKGDLIGFAKVTRDFTERKQTEENLRHSEQQMRSLFQFSPDAIVTTNQEGKITEVNEQMERFFGYKRGELIGQSVDILVPERFRRGHPKHREDYNAHPRTRPMGAGLELQGRRKDGSEFPIDIMLAPIETPEGRLVLSTIRDISERKEAEEAIRRAEQEKQYLEQELTGNFAEIIGESSGLKEVLKQVETVAPMDATVLILGETGTGKELIARAIHRLSRRRDRTFVKLNCAAIPSGLLESELFGHEKGAFTGAIAQKIGRLELANQGTLFLDEIGDIPLELQPKLLRALQEKEFERLGSTRTISVDVRLVAATNRELEKMVANKEFRSDLYYRLKVFPIKIPSLRDRKGDIPLLVRYFVHMHARRMDKHIETIPPEIVKAFTEWHWPGNVRELENFIERAVILTNGPVLRAPLAELEASREPIPATHATLEASEREHILQALRAAKGAIGGPDGAAKRLGLKRTTLNSKIKKLGIERADYS
jgi:formate hydrogenlyase transcriptional activator